MINAVVVRIVNQFNEICYSEIFDSPTKAGASKKANTFLKSTFAVKVAETELDNYRYWICKDIADLIGKKFRDGKAILTVEKIHENNTDCWCSSNTGTWLYSIKFVNSHMILT